jgi:hypothetical protein
MKNMILYEVKDKLAIENDHFNGQGIVIGLNEEFQLGLDLMLEKINCYYPHLGSNPLFDMFSLCELIVYLGSS